MKKLPIIVLLLAFCVALPVSAQKKKGKDKDKTEDKKKPDKKAQRELKREMMEYYYDIEKYEAVRNNMLAAKQKADSLDKMAKELREKETANNEEMQKIQDERNKKQEAIRKLEEELKNGAAKKEVPQEGTFFSVQIGAFNQGAGGNVSDMFKQVDLKVETDPSGLQKFLIGGYNSYEDAAAARKKFMKMGAKGAWIVAYKNGSRVPMTDVRNTPIPDDELREIETIKKQ